MCTCSRSTADGRDTRSSTEEERREEDTHRGTPRRLFERSNTSSWRYALSAACEWAAPGRGAHASSTNAHTSAHTHTPTSCFRLRPEREDEDTRRHVIGVGRSCIGTALSRDESGSGQFTSEYSTRCSLVFTGAETSARAVTCRAFTTQ